ncbi:glycosyltransferase [Lysobacter fragariae]
MHRSGTSALARILSLRGADLPEHVMPANRGNESGYWEPEVVVGLNERILDHFGVAWDDPFAAFQLPPANTFPARFKQEARRILKSEYGNSDLFVLKDPRCTLLLDFWLDALRSLDILPCPVVIMRPYAEVADSLLRRDMTNAASAVLLYVGYGLEAAASREAGASVVTYSQLVADWRSCTDRIAHEQGVAWPRNDPQVDADVEAFLSPPQRKFAVPQLPDDIAGWATRVWNWFERTAAGGHPPDSQLAKVRAELERARDVLAPLLVDRTRQIRDLKRSLDDAQAALGQAASERDTALSERDHLLDLHRQTGEQLQQTQATYQLREQEHERLREALEHNAQSRAQAEQSLAALKEQRDTALSERDRALRIHQDTEEQLRDAQASYQTLEQRWSELTTLHGQLASQRDLAIAERDALSDIHQRTEQELHSTEESYHQLERRFTELETAQGELAGQRDALVLERDAALQAQQGTEEQLRQTEASYQQLDLGVAELEAAQSELAGQRDALASQRDAAIQVQQATEDQLRQTEASYQQLERNLAALEAAQGKLASQRDELASERDAALRMQQVTEEQLRQTEASYQQLERNLAALEAAQGELASQRDELASERDAALKAHQATEEQLRQTEASYGHLEQDFTALQAARGELTRQRDALASERDAALRAQQGTEERLRQTETSYRKLERSFAELEVERDQVLRAQRSTEEQLRQTESSYRHMEQKCAGLEVVQGELMNQRETLTSERDDLIRMHQRIEDQLHRVEADYQERLRAEIESHGELARLHAGTVEQLHRTEANCQELQAQGHRQQATIETMGQQLAQLQGRVGELNDALARAAAEREGLSREIQSMLASRSWKVTAPLRGLGRLGRRMMGSEVSSPRTLGMDAASTLSPVVADAAVADADLGNAAASEPMFQQRDHASLRGFLAAEFGSLAADDVVLRIDRYRLPVESGNVRAASKIACTEDEARSWVAAIAQQASQRIDADAQPDVSIVIPVYNQLPFTLACIDALVAHETRYRFEILVGDDASTDATALALATPIQGVRHVRHGTNLGFVRNCNATAALARGRYVVMLNNDTQVLPGWLDEMIGTLEDNPGIGMSGSKLVFPDGRLQECGGIVWKDGSAWNFGRLQDPRRPEFCYMRDTDYVSGASIALPLELWRELDGFDELFVPAYAEDVDLAFRIRARGLRTVVQPLSQLLHFEGISSGTDTGQGAKAYQVENLRKLHERWHEVLQQHRDNADHPELEKERQVARRMLFIDLVTPTPKEDAGSLVAVEMMSAFRDNGYKITFIPEDNFAHMGASTRDLQRVGIETIYHPSYSSIDGFLSQCADEFDVILLVRFRVGEAHIERLRQRYPSARIIFSNCDLHYLREMREAELSGSQAALDAALDTKRRETDVIRRADVNMVHSEAELELLRRDVPGAPCVLFPLVHDPIEHCPPVAGRDGICFVGGYRHAPNADGITWFVEEIWPLVMARDPRHTLYIAGSSMTDQVKALSSHPNVEVVGFIDDLDGFLARRRATIAPLRFGAGAKGKVAVSLANGVPVVTTAVGAEGMQLEHDIQVLVADSAEDFAAHVLDILSQDELWLRMSAAGLKYAAEITSKASARRRAREIIEMLRLA